MVYGRLGSKAASFQQDNAAASALQQQRRRRRLCIVAVLSVVLIVAAVASTVALVVRREGSAAGSDGRVRRKPTQAISHTCSRTRFPTLCVDSLLDFPGSLTAGERDLVHISMNMTLQRFGKALYVSSEIANLQMDTRVRAAYEDCLELLEESVEQLSRSLTSVAGGGDGQAVGSTQDVLTWLSAAMTNQDTCTEGFDDVSGFVKDQMVEKLRDLSELVSNCLAIFAASGGDNDFAGVPIQNRRRRLMQDSDISANQDSTGFPKWLTRRERSLLQMPVPAIQADIIVSKDGNGTYKTITEAIKKAPEYSSRRTIIYVKAGRYEENNLKVGRKKTNLMFIGDGKGKTIITGGKSVFNNLTTFHTASFAATGAGFIARDMTFENWAGPGRHQAVALRVGADHGVVYRCNIIGYQDTLYVHSQRQFFRECDIYGTVDFIFGNAAVVFQNCSLYARKPMAQQKNTITAQNRKDPNQNTGISIHACRILPAGDLAPVKGSFPTYLGRPWKLYSRTVYMLSYMGDHIHPKGWLEWKRTYLAVFGHHRRRFLPATSEDRNQQVSGAMDSNRSINPSGYWTNEKHVQFLNSMEASFVRAMFESNGHPLPRLDRYLPDTSDSTLDLKTHPTRRFSTPVGSRARSDRGADKKASRPLSSQPYNSSQDQVVPQLESIAGDKA